MTDGPSLCEKLVQETYTAIQVFRTRNMADGGDDDLAVGLSATIVLSVLNDKIKPNGKSIHHFRDT